MSLQPKSQVQGDCDVSGTVFPSHCLKQRASPPPTSIPFLTGIFIKFWNPLLLTKIPTQPFPIFPSLSLCPLKLWAEMDRFPHIPHLLSWSVPSLLWVKAAPTGTPLSQPPPAKRRRYFQTICLQPLTSNSFIWHSHLSTIPFNPPFYTCLPRILSVTWTPGKKIPHYSSTEIMLLLLSHLCLPGPYS